MKTIRLMTAAVFALFVGATSLAAQETPAPGGDEEAPTHDWEFALSPTEHALGASGTVLVTRGDPTTFVVRVEELPSVDEFDVEDRDLNAFTVWIVPSRERVAESTLAGILTIDPETGVGTFEGTTELETFGIAVTATPDGAPETLTGLPVLTGIPVQAETPPTPAETPVPSPPGEVQPEAADPVPPEEPSEKQPQ